MTGLFANNLWFNEDIRAWNTSAVVDMAHMFSGARAFNQPLGSWDTSAVTTMQSSGYQKESASRPITSCSLPRQSRALAGAKLSQFQCSMACVCRADAASMDVTKPELRCLLAGGHSRDLGKPVAVREVRYSKPQSGAKASNHGANRWGKQTNPNRGCSHQDITGFVPSEWNAQPKFLSVHEIISQIKAGIALQANITEVYTKEQCANLRTLWHSYGCKGSLTMLLTKDAKDTLGATVHQQDLLTGWLILPTEQAKGQAANYLLRGAPKMWQTEEIEDFLNQQKWKAVQRISKVRYRNEWRFHAQPPSAMQENYHYDLAEGYMSCIPAPVRQHQPTWQQPVRNTWRGNELGKIGNEANNPGDTGDVMATALDQDSSQASQKEAGRERSRSPVRSKQRQAVADDPDLIPTDIAECFKNGWESQDVGGNGDCFYRSIAACQHWQKHHKLITAETAALCRAELRASAVLHAQKHSSRLSSWFAPDSKETPAERGCNPQATNISEWCELQMKQEVWADGLSIQCLAETLGLVIVIFKQSEDRWDRFTFAPGFKQDVAMSRRNGLMMSIRSLACRMLLTGDTTLRRGRHSEPLVQARDTARAKRNTRDRLGPKFKAIASIQAKQAILAKANKQAAAAKLCTVKEQRAQRAEANRLQRQDRERVSRISSEPGQLIHAVLHGGQRDINVLCIYRHHSDADFAILHEAALIVSRLGVLLLDMTGVFTQLMQFGLREGFKPPVPPKFQVMETTPSHRDDFPDPLPTPNLPPITGEDTLRAARQMHRKAAGLDGICPSWLALLPCEAHRRLAEMMDAFEQQGAWPEATCYWKIAALPKKRHGTLPSLGEVRPIAIGSAIYRIWGRIRLGHLAPILAQYLDRNQSGGIGGEDVSSLLLTLDIDLDPTKFPCLMALDFTKAFDSCDYTLALAVMSRLGLPARVVNLLGAQWRRQKRWMSFAGVCARLPIQNCLALPQGDPWSPIAMSLVLMLAKRHQERLVPESRCLLYLDDRTLVAPTPGILAAALNAWNVLHAHTRLRTNSSKTQVLGRNWKGYLALQAANLSPTATAEVLGVTIGIAPRAQSNAELSRAKKCTTIAQRISVLPVSQNFRAGLAALTLASKRVKGWLASDRNDAKLARANNLAISDNLITKLHRAATDLSAHEIGIMSGALKTDAKASSPPMFCHECKKHQCPDTFHVLWQCSHWDHLRRVPPSRCPLVNRLGWGPEGVDLVRVKQCAHIREQLCKVQAGRNYSRPEPLDMGQNNLDPHIARGEGECPEGSTPSADRTTCEDCPMMHYSVSGMDECVPCNLPLALVDNRCVWWHLPLLALGLGALGVCGGLVFSWNRSRKAKKIERILEEVYMVEFIMPRDASDLMQRQIAQGSDGIDEVIKSLSQVNSEEAKAWKMEDEIRVKSLIQDSVGFKHVDVHVTNVMITWIGSVLEQTCRELVTSEAGGFLCDGYKEYPPGLCEALARSAFQSIRLRIQRSGVKSVQWQDFDATAHSWAQALACQSTISFSSSFLPDYQPQL
ncbi:unnamed protein product [Cladocopium goreaui]|uniref:LINE-1 retrotransposable element ORF2 protein (ORF2p) n=1 Tax=Cladocopium goreaui TaxID=2562237 RepID=A0A9P1DGJ8_9DINO|nr:unnamed protein product [Cladocopium goreaui]